LVAPLKTNHRIQSILHSSHDNLRKRPCQLLILWQRGLLGILCTVKKKPKRPYPWCEKQHKLAKNSRLKAQWTLSRSPCPNLSGGGGRDSLDLNLGHGGAGASKIGDLGLGVLGVVV